MLLCGSYQPEAQARDRPKASLALRVGDTGKVRWRTPLPFTPTWASRWGGVIVTAGDGGATGLRAGDGRVAWEYATPSGGADVSDAVGHFGPGVRPSGHDPFGYFHLVGGRLLFVQGGRRLFAVDVENGRVLWTRWAPGARLRQPAPDGRFFHVRPLNADVDRWYKPPAAVAGCSTPPQETSSTTIRPPANRGRARPRPAARRRRLRHAGRRNRRSP